MKQFLCAPAIFLLSAIFAPGLLATSFTPSENDEIILKNGDRLQGRILGQDAEVVLFLKGTRHLSVSKEDIERIYDRPDTELVFTDILPKAGGFPPWWVMAYDLFYSDWVEDFKQIPATVIEEGDFQNVPYLSFRANRNFELNVYGNPDHPAGVEIGVYGHRRSSERIRAKLRDFLISYLHDLGEIRALNSIPLDGGRVQVNDLMIEITPPGAPDSYGGWWVSIWYPKALEADRVSPSELQRVTKSQAEAVRDMAGVTSWNKRAMEKANRRLRESSTPLIFEN